MKYTNKKRLAVQEIEMTSELATDIFTECNRLFFNSELPDLPIEIINDPTVNGDFKYDIDFGHKVITNYKIQISNARKRTKAKFISTMIHEILHYKVISNLSEETIKRAIWYHEDGNIDQFNQLLYNDKYAHTNEWLTYADNINKLYGIKINRG